MTERPKNTHIINRHQNQEEDTFIQPLVKTKLFVPNPQAHVIKRLKLSPKFEQTIQKPLTLVSAPAGYGKTSLVSNWIKMLLEKEEENWSVSWISLDKEDNDPTKFLTYLSVALENILPDFIIDSEEIIHNSQPTSTSTPLSLLINNLSDFNKPILLVFDDYHNITNYVIHEGITFLIEHLPPNMHLVILTRSDPPLPIARMRSHNLLSEIRAIDLRFSSDETIEFLKHVFNLDLTGNQISMLSTRTEGWIAGIQMAAISLQGRQDITRFIEEFSGSHRYIMDYLTEEALNRQPPEIQDFLIKTSILEELCAPLCNFILNNNQDSENPQSLTGPGIQNAQLRLTQLEESNLFIIPKDNHRIWFRYHHLFADLLQTRLQQFSPHLISTLHLRASIWFEENKILDKAISYSLKAKDWQNSIRLVVEAIPNYLENGQMATILKWIDQLPQDEIFRNPRLCVLIAEVYAQAGMIDRIDLLLFKAEEILKSNSDAGKAHHSIEIPDLSTKEITRIYSMIGILRGLKSVCANDPHAALNFTSQTKNNHPAMEPKELAVLFWVEGWAFRSLGKLDVALDTFEKANDYANKANAFLKDIWTDLAYTNRLVGKLFNAIDISNESIAIATRQGKNNQGTTSRDESFLSFIFLEQNQLELATQYANQAIEHTRWWPSHNIIATAYTSLSQILLAKNDLKGSQQAIERANNERKNRLMTPFIQSLIDITLVQTWLASDDWRLVNQWASEQISQLPPDLSKNDIVDEYLEMRMIMLVRVWVKQIQMDNKRSRYPHCLDILDCLERSAKFVGRINSLVEILFLKACILYAQGKTAEAIMVLEECLSFGQEGGYMRIFLISGNPALSLLTAYSQTPNPLYKAYVFQIIAEFQKASQAQQISDNYPEAITPRELEVIQLLALGYSNRKIAESLILSEGTIKFHVHNILEKLHVQNRTQALLKAKKLGLI